MFRNCSINISQIWQLLPFESFFEIKDLGDVAKSMFLEKGVINFSFNIIMFYSIQSTWRYQYYYYICDEKEAILIRRIVSHRRFLLRDFITWLLFHDKSLKQAYSWMISYWFFYEVIVTFCDEHIDNVTRKWLMDK